jgi:hypothetical protein
MGLLYLFNTHTMTLYPVTSTDSGAVITGEFVYNNNNRLNIFAFIGTLCLYLQGSTHSHNPHDQSMKTHYSGNLKMFFLVMLRD